VITCVHTDVLSNEMRTVSRILVN